MADSERVLIDTSALYALRSADDRFHDRANAAFQDLIQSEMQFWATSYTLVETVALMHRRLGFQAVAMDATVFTFDGGFANQGLAVVPR